MSAPADAYDRFPAAVAVNIFGRLLAVPECAIAIQEIFPFVKLSEGHLAVEWRQLRSDMRSNVAWLWLQQLGLARHLGSELLIDAALRPYAADSLPRGRMLTQAELDVRLAAQQARGALAEEYIVERERRRLVACGCPHYAVGVRRVSVDNVEAGYDIRSFETNGDARYIEVKSSAGPRSFFILSINEYRCARRHGASYWIAWVGWAVRLPDGDCDNAWFRDPAAIIKNPGSSWTVTPAQLCVQRTGDDSSFQTKP
jgi:hypothetical protein